MTTEIKRKKRGQFSVIWKRFCKNKLAVFGLCFIIFIVLVAIFAPFIAPYGYDDHNIVARFQEPNSKYLLGTDSYGRDILSRMIYGARVSLGVGISATMISSFLGISIGVFAGYYGGKIDNVIMRITDVFLAIPSILLSIVIAATLGGGLGSMLIAISLGSVPGVARLSRALVLSEREKEYIESARTSGSSDLRIIVKYVLLNISAPLIVAVTLGIGGGILSASLLSFIGLGAQPPIPEWGAMLSEGRAYIRDYPYLVLSPGIFIMLTVFSQNMLGDGLRDALDPRLKGR